LIMLIKENSFKIIVKPNSSKNEVLCYDKGMGAYRIAINAKPEGNKANVEIIKFLSRLLKKKVSIVKGLRSKEKIIKTMCIKTKHL